jgi:hypothetical protein
VGSIPHRVKPNEIGVCCFCTKHAALRRKSKDWLAWNQDNVSERHVYPQTVISVSKHYKNPTNHVGQVQSDLIIISLKINLFLPS